MEEEKKVVEGEAAPEPEVKEEVKHEERPEVNYKAELDRKNREIDRLRMEADSARANASNKRDPNDLKTWADHELKAIVSSNDPTVLAYKEQANDLLLERKVRAIQARERENEKRVGADLEIRSKYPDSLDPFSELAVRMEQLIQEHDLSRTPAGRLVAAKLASLELSKNKVAGDEKGRKAEADRLKNLKDQMVDDDRPNSTAPNNDKKTKNLEDALMDTKHENRQVDAISQILKDRGMDRQNFFGKR